MTNLQEVPNNNSEPQQSARIPAQTFITQISSPLPPPEMLISYEKAQPGLINKIIEMTDNESKHRRELEKQQLHVETSHLERGDQLISKAQSFALIIAISTIIGGCITAICGAQIAGSIIGASGIVGIIGAFIKNSKR